MPLPQQKTINKLLTEAKILFNAGKYKRSAGNLLSYISKLSKAEIEQNYELKDEIFKMYKQIYEAMLFFTPINKIKPILVEMRKLANDLHKGIWIELEILEMQIRHCNFDVDPKAAKKYADKYYALYTNALKKVDKDDCYKELLVWAGSKFLKLKYYAPDYAEVIPLGEKLVSYAHEINLREAELWVSHHLGLLYLKMEKYVEARKYFQKSLDISYELNQRDGIIWNAYNLGSIAMKEHGNEEMISNYIYQAISTAAQTDSFNDRHSEMLKSYLPDLNKQLDLFNRLVNSSKFVASEIHELKNILTGAGLGISNLKYRLGAEKSDNDTAELLADLESAHKVMTEKVKDILSYVRNQEQLMDLASVELNDFLKVFVKRTATLLRENKIELKITNFEEPNMHHLAISAKLLYQVLLNLLLNAIEALGDSENKLVEIIFAKDAKGYFLRFKDNGSGIDKQTAKKIFEPFFTTKKEGTGLGLYVIKKLLNEKQLDIILEDCPQGASFKIINLEILKN